MAWTAQQHPLLRSIWTRSALVARSPRTSRTVWYISTLTHYSRSGRVGASPTDCVVCRAAPRRGRARHQGNHLGWRAPLAVFGTPSLERRCWAVMGVSLLPPGAVQAKGLRTSLRSGTLLRSRRLPHLVLRCGALFRHCPWRSCQELLARQRTRETWRGVCSTLRRCLCEVPGRSLARRHSHQAPEARAAVSVVLTAVDLKQSMDPRLGTTTWAEQLAGRPQPSSAPCRTATFCSATPMRATGASDRRCHTVLIRQPVQRPSARATAP